MMLKKLTKKLIIDSLNEKIKEIFKEKNVNIIKLRKGSLSIAIALNYLVTEKLSQIDKIIGKDFFKELNNYFKIETKNIKKILKDNLTIAQKRGKI